MMAKALANEAEVNFIYRSASEFVEKYVGVGPRRIRDLFDEAKLKSPCIVFIDEIDAIGARTVATDHFGQNNDERNATVNQLLVEMDGFDETDLVVVVAATNRERFLDFALVRSGRFDLKVRMDMPDKGARLGILRLKLLGVKLDKSALNVDLEAENEFFGDDVMVGLAERMEGLSGADIEAVVNEAVYHAFGRRREGGGVGEAEDGGVVKLELVDLEFGLDRVRKGVLEVRNAAVFGGLA